MARNINLEKLVRHKLFLEETIDPDSGLLDELLRSGTLTRREIRNINDESPYHNRNAKLLEYITDQRKCDSFVISLRNTKQDHIVNYLMADAENQSEFDLNWPLTDAQVAIIDVNQAVLVRLIDMSELIGRLYSRDVISQRQRNAICSEVNQDKKNQMFLEFLRRRSQRDFEWTVNFLDKSKQTHVAEILKKGGVVVPIHANTDATAETEREIAERCMRIIGDRPLEECMRILEHMQFNIIAAKAGESIVFYVLCQTMQQLERLQVSIKDGTFRESVGWLINEVLLCKQTIKILSIRIKEDAFTHIKQCAKAGRLAIFDRKWVTANETESPRISLTELPLEVLDIILQKSYLYCVLPKSSVGVSAQEIISSVSICWSQRLTKRNFKATIWKRMFGFYGNKKERHDAMLTNAHYLQTLSLSPFEMNRLKSADLIADAQAARIQRRRLKYLKERARSTNQNCSIGVSKMVKSLDQRSCSSFLRYIRQTARRVVAKVELRDCFKTETMTTKSNLIERLSDMLSGKALKTNQDNRHLNKLREDDLEIVDVLLDRDIVCWIWCRSENGIENLQMRDYGKMFSEIFAGLAKAPRGQTLRMNVDDDSFRKAMVSLFTCCNFTKKLEYKSTDPNESWVNGITKLGSNIYALCGRPHANAIHVFEDQNEFRLLDKIPLQGISDPLDIGSSERDICLYVTVPEESCIWKITEETGESYPKKNKIAKWLETDKYSQPWTLSVSSDGQLLISSYGWPDILRVYGPDAELCLSILLPKGVMEIRHAVKARNGNFIILHDFSKDIDNVGTAEIDELFRQLKSMYYKPIGKALGSGMIARSHRDPENRAERNTDEKEEKWWTISEWSRDGKKIVRLYIPANDEEKLREPCYLSIDSTDRLFVADAGNDRVILLDSDLKWNQTLISKELEYGKEDREILNFEKPYRLFYDEQIKQLIGLGSFSTSFHVYTLTTKCKRW